MMRATLILATFALSGCLAPGGTDTNAQAPAHGVREQAEIDPVTPTKTFYADLPPRISPSLQSTALGQALTRALGNGATLRAAQAGESVARTTAAEIEASFKPSFGLSLSSEINSNGSQGIQPAITMRQRLYDGGATRHKLSAARAQTVVAGADTVDRLTLRALESVGAWEELNLARNLKSVAQASLRRHREIAEKVERRISAGAGSNAEALRIKSRTADAAARVASATRRELEAQTRARELFNTLPQVGRLPTAPAPNATLENNPRLIALRAQQRSVASELQARQSELSPAVFLEVTGRAPSGQDANVGAGLSVDYTLGTQDSRFAAVRRAQAEVQRVTAEAELVRAELQRTLENANTRQSALRQELRAARNARNAAAEALSNAEVQFGSRGVSLIDLLDLGRELDEAEGNYAELQSDLRFAGYEKLAASGDLLDAFGLCFQACQR